MEIETRIITLENANLRIRKRDNGTPVIDGYAAVFNRWSENLGGFVERIKPQAFTNALKRSDARGLFNHNADYLLGRQSAKTLQLKEDKTGLFMEIDPPDTRYARDLMVSIERGDVREQSFGFTVESDTWDDQDKDIMKRTINEIGELFDVSPVTFPAYPDTTVALRSLNQMRENNAATSETHKGVTAIERYRLKIKIYERM